MSVQQHSRYFHGAIGLIFSRSQNEQWKLKRAETPLCKCTDIPHFDHHAQFWSSSLRLKLQKVWYNPKTCRMAAEGTQESAASTSSSSVRVSEAASPGRLQTVPLSGSSHRASVETPYHVTTIRGLQDSRGDWQICSGLLTAQRPA